MSVATGIAASTIILVPSSPLIQPQSSNSSYKGSLVPSKYFGQAPAQTKNRNGGGQAVVKDSFGLWLDGEKTEQEDEGLPALGDIFKKGRKERDGSLRKPPDDVHSGREDLDAIYSKSKRKVEEGIRSSKASHKLKTRDCTDKVVPGVVDSSSQGPEESTYFTGTNESRVADIDVTTQWSKEPTSKPFHARDEENEQDGLKATSKSKRAKAAVTNNEDPKPKRRGKRKDAVGAKSAPKAVEGVAQENGKRERRKTSGGESQCTIKGTRISKPGTERESSSEKTLAARQRGKSDDTSSKLENNPSIDGAAALKISPSEEGSDVLATLGIDKAIPRRHNWTPTKQTSTSEAVCIADEKDGSPSLTEKSMEDSQKAKKFDKFLGAFSYPIPYDSSTTSEMSRFTSEGSTKRRKLELLTTLNPQRPSKPVPKVKQTKAKQPKKKYQTISAKATEAFRAPRRPDGTSLLDYFTSSSESTAENRNAPTDHLVIDDEDEGFDVLGPVTNLIPRVRSKVPENFQTPELALKALEQQDLVFGTSSQLATQISPTVIRSIQQAIKDSEKDGQTLQSICSTPVSPTSGIKPAKSLWSAASRDVDGSLLEVELIDLSNTPKLVGSDENNLRLSAPTLTTEESRESIESDPWLPIDSVIESRSQRKETKTQPIKPSEAPISPPKVLARHEVALPRSIAESHLRRRPSPVKRRGASNHKSLFRDLHTPPTLNDWSDEDLSKTLKSYGFKLTLFRSRKKRIDQLMNCWESKRREVFGEDVGNVPKALESADKVKTTIDSSTVAQPPKDAGTSSDAFEEMLPVRARAKKSNKASKATTTAPPTAAAESEETTSKPKRPRGRPRKNRPPEPDPSVSVSTSTPAIPSTTITPTLHPNKTPNPNATLLTSLSAAITSQPPTHLKSHPSWREKMALYDPIVLEELTTWLNTEGLRRVGEDDEVWPALVREWCESRGVCCVWGVNWAGKRRRGERKGKGKRMGKGDDGGGEGEEG